MKPAFVVLGPCLPIALLLASCSASEGAAPVPRPATERLSSFSRPAPVWSSEEVAAHEAAMEVEAGRVVRNDPHDPRELFHSVARGEGEDYEDYANRLARLSDGGWFTFDVPIAGREPVDELRSRLEFDGLRSAVDQTLKVRVDADLSSSEVLRRSRRGTEIAATRTVGDVYTLVLDNWSRFTAYCPQVIGDGDLGVAAIAADTAAERRSGATPDLGMRFVVELRADPTQDHVEEPATVWKPAELEARFHRLPSNLAMIIVYDRRTREVLDFLPGPPLGG